MASVTKMKAEVTNRNLPILTPDGEVTNYYYGNFYNKIEGLGYALSVDEKTAVKNFIDSAINNGYIDYIRYMLPFIGDSDHPNAGLVPLIDNVDGYAMREYSGAEDYSDGFFEFDSQTGKILSIHNTYTGDDLIKTPVDYSLEKGFSVMFTAKYETPNSFGNVNTFLNTDTVEKEETNYYIRLRYNLGSVSPRIQTLNTSNYYFESWKLFSENIENAITNAYNVNCGFCYNKNEDGQVWRWQSIEMPGFKTIGRYADNPSFDWEDLNYGKYYIGRNMINTYLKMFVFVSPNLSLELKGQLSSDMLTLVTALGR